MKKPGHDGRGRVLSGGLPPADTDEEIPPDHRHRSSTRITSGVPEGRQFLAPSGGFADKAGKASKKPSIAISSRSKARCTGFDGLAGWLADAGGNKAIGVDDRKLFHIFTALQIERLDRLVVGAIDMNHLAWI